MKAAFNFLVLSLILVLLGCSKGDTVEPILIGEEFTLTYQSVYQLDNSEINFQFSEVLEEKRCPRASTCHWGGWIQVKITITEGVKEIDLELHANGENATDGVTTGTFDKFQIDLIEVTPYPITNRRIETEDYKVILKITEL